MANKIDHDFLTKRTFLQTIGMLGGSAAAYTAMSGLNLTAQATASEPPKLMANGQGKKVIILGAGVSGLVCAYELMQKGYDCTVIEARPFAGGRCQTARNGSIIQETGSEAQHCEFTHDQYFNIGPWRIAAEHHGTIHYCHEAGVSLEPLINKSPQGYIFSENIDGPLKNTRLRIIETEIDRAGNVAELLAKSAQEGLLDEKLSGDDVEQLIEYLRSTGLIDRRLLDYRPNKARGYSKYPTTGHDAGTLSDIKSLQEILKVKLAATYDTADHPAVMFQIQGGMDQLPKMLSKKLPGNSVHYNAEVTDIMQNDDGVKVSYKNPDSGDVSSTSGDYCISTIPFSVFGGINNNFAPNLQDAIKSSRSAPAIKVGLQMKRRFWEQDDMIYGGHSYSDIPGHNLISYPSSELFARDRGGVLLAAYRWGNQGVMVSNMSNEDRAEFALSIGEKIHPGQYRQNYNGQAISVGWHKMKYSMGAAIGWSARNRQNKLPIVINGDKRVLFSGDGLSPFNSGWMIGAIEAAWITIADLDKRVSQS